MNDNEDGSQTSDSLTCSFKKNRSRNRTVPIYKLCILGVAILGVGFFIAIGYFSKNCDCDCDTREPPRSGSAGNSSEIVFNPLQNTETCVVDQNEPICLFPFPKEELNGLNIKCCIPCKGNYVMKTKFSNYETLTICLLKEETHHYKLSCTDEPGFTCNSACSNDCDDFHISAIKADTLVLQIDISCIKRNGYIEVWNSTTYERRKRNT